MDCNNPAQITPCPQAVEAAEKAVAKTFAILGVDIHDPAQVAEFQDDLRFGRKVRRSFERGLFPAFLTIIGLIGAAFIAGLRFGK
ncbi:hypothetical protein [Desulfuromonas thiophila]|uniref:Uncharacterized protein n=1 Tax=Desulfuromonas thiophila TaxID=57664 RepID=A0A1G7B0V0_9BACT|nr:hypothetical protein [Desulfuromonas thiophila]SDE20641.1 hypothetical protein SAMN05661003_1055 [Desulfuromonas thiophila]